MNTSSATTEWPILRTFDAANSAFIKMPVGGIGTGCISLSGSGQLVDWEIFNRPNKGFTPESFFAIRLSDGTETQTRLLEGPIPDQQYDHPDGRGRPLAGLPRFADSEFRSAYPFGQVALSDPQLPVSAVVQAYNPLIPGDVAASSIPALIYRVLVTNTSAAPLQVSVAANLLNVVGHRHTQPLPDGNSFERLDGPSGTMLLGSSSQVPEDAESFGTLALAALDQVSSSRTSWAKRSWGDSLLDFWDDFSADGQLDEPAEAAKVPTGSLVLSKQIPAGQSASFGFLIGWHFPNRRAWTNKGVYGDLIIGNYYTQQYRDAAEVLTRLIPQLAELESRTADFVETLSSTDLPATAIEAALANLAVLKSQTCLRSADGTFLAWEGSNPHEGSCHGSCTHVWNYQYALEQLFPELAWSMREVEFRYSLNERGMMSFRSCLPLETNGTEWPVAAADGQMGAILRLFRTWQLSGDDEKLRTLWPGVKRAIEFAWIPKGWDADQDGVMEGCQHNTMDVEYYGPSGVNQSWYLAALAACAELAEHLDEPAFAEQCRKVLASGAAGTEEVLFNGEYYQQKVIPPLSEENIAEGLRIRYDHEGADEGSDDLVDPALQIGSGSTSDQLVGHSMAQLSGLSTGLDPAHTAKAINTVFEHNHRENFYSHFNHLRSYALGDEKGLLNCTFPRGDRPVRPFPYCHEVWTGLEYSAAIGLALEGQYVLAEQVVQDVRDRFSGRRRNPFNEMECGDHYVRSMASFGLLHAWSGLVYDARNRTITLRAVPGVWPVVAGELMGQVKVANGQASFHSSAPGAAEVSVRLVD
ncbi:GH116 family glycosyl-hydrolase [Psychromicrobium lacuslunae]|uniref:GH116 family glycosyl-hydrolase n=1 Tax=Psychromicrobium lacuslunae TaxID=1618207 RepID=UPI000698AA57|nr:GH116 family glycosyl-hydrolase [Psychromicrobium lacuslunae]